MSNFFRAPAQKEPGAAKNPFAIVGKVVETVQAIDKSLSHLGKLESIKPSVANQKAIEWLAKPRNAALNFINAHKAPTKSAISMQSFEAKNDEAKNDEATTSAPGISGRGAK